MRIKVGFREKSNMYQRDEGLSQVLRSSVGAVLAPGKAIGYCRSGPVWDGCGAVLVCVTQVALTARRRSWPSYLASYGLKGCQYHFRLQGEKVH